MNDYPTWQTSRLSGVFLAALFMMLPSVSAGAYTQQGSKLVGSDAVGSTFQGFSVALSSNGDTMIVGGYGDNGNVGASWVFTRTGGIWTQQGTKLVGTGAAGIPSQGYSVSLAADGNTALVGGYGDSPSGAAWVFTRSGSTWTQQGNKLVGTGAIGNAQQGASVSLSSDGNTALIGGPLDNSGVGAAWVFTRTGNVWSQQGSKLIGSEAVGDSSEGFSVSLSADGNTAIIGGFRDNAFIGAAWVFARTGGIWSQQGNKLVGTGAIGNANQGYSVSLSSDGNAAAVGGVADNIGNGAVWVFTRVGDTWSQQGNKLFGVDTVGASQQGQSVSLSSDGNTALVGGWADNSSTGAAWVFTRSGGVWTQSGSKLVGTGAAGSAGQGQSVFLSGDSSTAALGGFIDQSGIGATWVFTTTVTTVAIPVMSTMSLVLLAAFLAVMSVYRLRCM